MNATESSNIAYKEYFPLCGLLGQIYDIILWIFTTISFIKVDR